MCASPTARAGRAAGFTLIELIVFIIIVGVGLSGILSVLNLTVTHSADPMVRKQMLALAESLLEEVTLMPFTYCDPDDANASTATGTADCAGGTAAETRGGATPFDNVADYNGLNLNPVTDAAGNNHYAGYSAAISVTPTTVADANRLNGLTADADVLLIAVTVTRGTETLTLHGYRTRHSPTLLP